MDPAPLMGSKAVRLITAGNIEDDLEKAGQADWIALDVSTQLGVVIAVPIVMQAGW